MAVELELPLRICLCAGDYRCGHALQSVIFAGIMSPASRCFAVASRAAPAPSQNNGGIAYVATLLYSTTTPRAPTSFVHHKISFGTRHGTQRGRKHRRQLHILLPLHRQLAGPRPQPDHLPGPAHRQPLGPLPHRALQPDQVQLQRHQRLPPPRPLARHHRRSRLPRPPPLQHRRPHRHPRAPARGRPRHGRREEERRSAVRRAGAPRPRPVPRQPRAAPRAGRPDAQAPARAALGGRVCVRHGAASAVRNAAVRPVAPGRGPRRVEDAAVPARARARCRLAGAGAGDALRAGCRRGWRRLVAVSRARWAAAGWCGTGGGPWAGRRGGGWDGRGCGGKRQWGSGGALPVGTDGGRAMLWPSICRRAFA
ncbi:hypothetical protein B0J12DRAFT_106136 [Macrophomina phaseolina]|uniref:Uncharacterized protein n=1 Tax=Macrophomina phaseolina TaxID=35725 RepID=A0ABQ8FPD1_9PEZI|nr:hypothetical protein B0J12DRAFT_106136 [Macrophomina phaseolina]